MNRPNIEWIEQMYLDIPPPYDVNKVAAMQVDILTLVAYVHHLEAVSGSESTLSPEVAAHIRQEDTASGAPKKSGWFR